MSSPDSSSNVDRRWRWIKGKDCHIFPSLQSLPFPDPSVHCVKDWTVCVCLFGSVLCLRRQRCTVYRCICAATVHLLLHLATRQCSNRFNTMLWFHYEPSQLIWEVIRIGTIDLSCVCVRLFQRDNRGMLMWILDSWVQHMVSGDLKDTGPGCKVNVPMHSCEWTTTAYWVVSTDRRKVAGRTWVRELVLKNPRDSRLTLH